MRLVAVTQNTAAALQSNETITSSTALMLENSRSRITGEHRHIDNKGNVMWNEI